MKGFFVAPTWRMIGVMFAASVVFLLTAVWMINFGGADVAAYAFPPLLIGMVLAGMALAQVAMRKLNQSQGEPPPGA